MKHLKIISFFYLMLVSCSILAQEKTSRFKVLAIGENGGHHILHTNAAKIWLNKLAADSNFTIDYYTNSKPITRSFLEQYQLFIQIDYPPYTWSKESEDAFIEYIEQGKGGWIGFHHATLLGTFDGFPLWQWFSSFMGGIKFKSYIAEFAAASVNVENKKHPIMKGVPASFPIVKEEWYTYDKSPRLSKDILVLASADENTYTPARDIKMGDHPVIWTNTKMKARNVYVFMGHGPELFENPSYTTLYRNAIFWAASKKK
ncbi:MAG: ThuA domain-containing protein [Bacteroidota bacterium]